MRSPDPIAEDRLEELLGGAVPEAEYEARVQGLVRELRAGGPLAPAALLGRVSELGKEPVRARRRVPVPRWRPALAIGLVLLLLAGMVATVALRGEGGDDDAGQADVPAAAPSPVAPEAGDQEAGASAPYRNTLRKSQVTLDSGAGLVSGEDSIDRRRATDVDLRVELRLRDADELADASGRAMAITRELGGWVASSDVDAGGREGEAALQLRVPVRRVEDAVVRLSELGTITGQRMVTTDLQGGIDVRDRRIEKLDRKIRITELRLESETLEPEERLRLEIRLERLHAARTDLARANARDRREAAIAELTLLLHTREAPAGAEPEEGEAAGAARDALRLLGAVGVVALFAAIVLSPVLLLALLLWLAMRSRARRIETKLLDRPEPAGPPPK
ncbi:MAG: DUF4349 domain-containing protein [Gaiellaceae bacterium]